MGATTTPDQAIRQARRIIANCKGVLEELAEQRKVVAKQSDHDDMVIQVMETHGHPEDDGDDYRDHLVDASFGSICLRQLDNYKKLLLKRMELAKQLLSGREDTK